jgi:hypothetical protein
MDEGSEKERRGRGGSQKAMRMRAQLGMLHSLYHSDNKHNVCQYTDAL